MKGRVLGIYLGIDGVGVAEFDRKKLLATAYMPFAALEEEVASYDQLSSQIKTEALIQRLLRKIKAEAVEAVVALPERDLTFRTLDMPLLKKGELMLALPLEVEKYIPFKLNDVYWDHQARNVNKEKKTQVAFLSAKKDSADELKSILENVNIHVNRVDAAALSSVSFLSALGKIPKKAKNFVAIFYGGKEAEIAIYEDGFPKFSRYTKVPLDFEGKENIVKFIDDVRLTIGYYKREASQAKLDYVYLVAPDEAHAGFANLSDDLAIPAELISLDNIYSEQRLSTLYEFKACALAMRVYGKATEGFNLLQEEKAAAIAEKDIMNYFKAQEPEAPLDARPIVGVLALCLLVFCGVYFAMQPEVKKLEDKKAKLQAEMKKSKIALSDEKKIKNEHARVDNINKTLASVSVPDRKINSILSAVAEDAGNIEGLWLSELGCDLAQDESRLGIYVKGYVYIDSPDLEQESFTRWIDMIKQKKALVDNNYAVSIESMERSVVYDYSVTKFSVKLGKNE